MSKELHKCPKCQSYSIEVRKYEEVCLNCDWSDREG